MALAFDPDQPRDAQGRFVEVGGASFIRDIVGNKIEGTVAGVVKSGKDRGKIKLIGKYGEEYRVDASELNAGAEENASRESQKKDWPTTKSSEYQKDFTNDRVDGKLVLQDGTLPSDLEDAGQEWASGLTSGERAALGSWTRGATGNGAVNSLVQKEKDGRHDDPTLMKFRKALDKAPTFEGVAYRGMNLKEDSEMFSALSTEGAEIEYSASHSLSVQASTASFFTDFRANESPVLCRVKVKTAKSIEYASKAESERELIGRRGAKYRVIRVEKQASAFIVSARSSDFKNIVGQPMQVSRYAMIVDLEEVE
jgi:hypothetical protein